MHGHLNKTEMCAKQNVKLIHIFEDEYQEHKEIVLNKLKYILSCSDNEKIAARKTTVTDIDKTTAKEFLNKNHIQGFAKSTFYLGCYYNGTLIAVMTFVRKNKKDFDGLPYCDYKRAIERIYPPATKIRSSEFLNKYMCRVALFLTMSRGEKYGYKEKV